MQRKCNRVCHCFSQSFSPFIPRGSWDVDLIQVLWQPGEATELRGSMCDFLEELGREGALALSSLLLPPVWNTDVMAEAPAAFLATSLRVA